MGSNKTPRLAAAGLAVLATILTGVAMVSDPSSADWNSLPSRFVTAEWMPFRVTVRSSIDGHVLRVLWESDHDHRPHFVAVSPDGSIVYFSRFHRAVCDNGIRTEASEIVRVPVDGGPVEPLVPPARGEYMAITPDGSALTYTSDASGTGCGESGGRLVRRDLETGETETLIDPERDGVGPSQHHSWTPDGSRLLLDGYPTVDGVPRLFRVDLDGGVRVTPLKDNHDFPKGVAVSNETYAASYLDEDGYHVALFDFDGNLRRILFDYEAAFIPKVDPSRRHFFYETEGKDGKPSTLVRWNEVIGRKALAEAFFADVAWVPDTR